MTVPAPLYGRAETERYPAGAPHLRHERLRRLFAARVREAFEGLEDPEVLELGAGGGAATAVVLEHGARVTAVDNSESQLAVLRAATAAYGDRVRIHVVDAEEILRSADEHYDALVAVSFLHHVPDYLALLELALARLRPCARVLTFQDPLLHASLGRAERIFAAVAYDLWRLRQGDVGGGVTRRLRRRRGVWRDDCPQDVIEYHATRGGVDQDAVVRLLERRGFAVSVDRYFSTQLRSGQLAGSALGFVNTFSVIGKRG